MNGASGLLFIPDNNQHLIALSLKQASVLALQTYNLLIIKLKHKIRRKPIYVSLYSLNKHVSLDSI